jgi:hypothetical protein
VAEWCRWNWCGNLHWYMLVMLMSLLNHLHMETVSCLGSGDRDIYRCRVIFSFSYL